MKIALPLVALACLTGTFGEGQSTTTGPARTSGTCSVAHSGNNDTIIIKNCGIGKEQGDKIVGMLNKILAGQDPSKILIALEPKLNEILAAESKPTYQQTCVGSACAQGPGSQATFNQLGSPLPKVTASPQKQMQTGNSDAPWATVFTISTNVLVQTGDLRLKCDGPVLRAGISRINPASLSTGNNGPNPNDPNEAIYQLGPEMLSPGQIVKVAVYSQNPVNILSGSIGPNAIIF